MMMQVSISIFIAISISLSLMLSLIYESLLLNRNILSNSILFVLLFHRYGPHFEDAPGVGQTTNLTVQAGCSVYLNCRISLLQDKTVTDYSNLPYILNYPSSVVVVVVVVVNNPKTFLTYLTSWTNEIFLFGRFLPMLPNQTSPLERFSLFY